MKRRNWLLALFGIGAAKALPRDRFAAIKGLAPMTPQASDLNYDPICPSGRVFPRGWKPVNGRCPVCGTMAENYSQALMLKEQRAYRAAAINAIRGSSPSPESFMQTMATLDALVGADTSPSFPARQVRCKTCNAAFWQDAEK